MVTFVSALVACGGAGAPGATAPASGAPARATPTVLASARPIGRASIDLTFSGDLKGRVSALTAAPECLVEPGFISVKLSGVMDAKPLTVGLYVGPYQQSGVYAITAGNAGVARLSVFRDSDATFAATRGSVSLTSLRPPSGTLEADLRSNDDDRANVTGSWSCG